MQLVDSHVHCGIMFREAYPDQVPLTPHQLVDRMNRQGISHSVLLPLESPEGSWGYLLTEDVLRARDLYPERLIACVAADPRYPKAVQQIEHFVTRHGCKGFGELVDGLAFDDARHRAIYDVCDALRLPLVFEINHDLCYDQVGLPALETCLNDYPHIRWVGHGPGFWAAISGDDDGQAGYPTRPIVPGGAVDRLLTEYDNLYADLSAGSGYNAMTRDPDYTTGFLARHWRKLMFGTDYLAPGQSQPQVPWFRGLELPEEQRLAIGCGNAIQLFGIEA